jgi:hypothetical protein
MVEQGRALERVFVLAAAVVALAAVALVLVADRPPARRPGLGAALRTNGRLVVRQEALLTTARDLSEQVCRRIEEGLPANDGLDGLGGGHAPRCQRPPWRDAANDEVLAWLSDQGAQLEARTR